MEGELEIIKKVVAAHLIPEVNLFFGCEDAAQQVLMSVLVNQSQAIQSNANEFRLCAFLDFVSKSKLEGYIVMEGTFRLCAFLFCVSKSKP